MTVSILWKHYKEEISSGNVVEAIESKIKKNSGRKTKWDSEEINSLLVKFHFNSVERSEIWKKQREYLLQLYIEL